MITKYRKDIQALRGLAVIAVLLFHAKESYFPFGYLGVDVFFVISGFAVTPLILRIFTGNVTKGDSSRLKELIQFYRKRFYRLAPALTTMLVFSTIAIILLGPANDHRRFARQGIATLLLMGNFGASRYSGDYFSPDPNPLLHTWSLSVEAQIYIFLPLVLMLIFQNRKFHKNIFKVVLASVMTISFISFLFPVILQPLYRELGIQPASKFSFYSPIDRIWEFLLGGLVFLLANRNDKYKSKLTKKIDLMLIASLIMILFGGIHLGLKLSSILTTLTTAIVIARQCLERFANFLILWLGDRSYSIYLVHLPLLYIAKYSPIVQIGTRDNRIIQTLIALGISLLFGHISYSLIENKYRNVEKRNFASLKTSIITLLITLCLPFTMFFTVDRLSLSHGSDGSLPIPAKTQPWDWDPTCKLMGTDTEMKKPCSYGNQKSPESILVIGDSHAASDSRATIEVAQKKNMSVSVLTQGSCPFILNVKELSNRFKLVGMDSNCLHHNEAILNYVRISKPKITILAMRNTSTDIIPNTVSSRMLIRHAMLISLSKLIQLKTNVVLIGAEPEYYPVKTWAQHFLGQKGSYSRIPMEDSHYWSTIRLNGYTYLSTVKIFCPQNICKNRVGSIWLFNDGEHLSKEGTELLKPPLDKIIDSIKSK